MVEISPKELILVQSPVAYLDWNDTELEEMDRMLNVKVDDYAQRVPKSKQS